MTKSNERTFMKITNKDIYDSIINLKSSNDTGHNKIITRLDKTNGNVKINKWVSRTAITLSLIVLGWFVGFLITTMPK